MRLFFTTSTTENQMVKILRKYMKRENKSATYILKYEVCYIVSTMAKIAEDIDENIRDIMERRVIATLENNWTYKNYDIQSHRYPIGTNIEDVKYFKLIRCKKCWLRVIEPSNGLCVYCSGKKPYDEYFCSSYNVEYFPEEYLDD